MIEKIVEELKKVFSFKEKTTEGDIVLVVSEDPQMLLYGIIFDIERDERKKGEWWHVTINLLTIPPQKVVWTLRTQQFTGQEIFTMGGKKKYVRAVDLSDSKSDSAPPAEKQKTAKTALRVVK
jgi:hypothetical protein